MSQQAGTEQTTQGQNNGTGEVQAQQTQTGNEQQQNNQQQQQSQPAPYAPYLERVPESVRGLVEPVFRDWDAGVTQRFQQLHSQFGWAEPWQEIAQQYDPDTVSQSLQVLQALSTDPEGFYKALGESYGYGQQPQQQQQMQQQFSEFSEQGQQQSQQQDDPRFAQLEQLVGSLAEVITGDRQAQQEAAEEQQLYAYLDQLKQEHGEFDQDYVLTKIAAGTDPVQAVMQYRQLVGQNSQQSPGQQAPVVMSGSGGVPSNTRDIRQLDRKQTQGLVASVLAAQNQQG